MSESNFEPSQLLTILQQRETFQSNELAEQLNIDHQKVVGAIKSLQSHEELVDVKEIKISKLQLTPEGEQVLAEGSHEYRVFDLVGEQGVPKAIIDVRESFGPIGFGKAISAGWITTEVKNGVSLVVRKAKPVEDKARHELKQINEGMYNLDTKTIGNLKKRKWINEMCISLNNLFKKGSWRNKNFKKYNFEAMGIIPQSGHLHPLLKVRAEFRDIFFQMGFSEMPTNKFVESSFWNFDALFQPQQHPARDSHDTFFLTEGWVGLIKNRVSPLVYRVSNKKPEPAISTEFPKDYVERVKKVHSEGGYGSLGYKYDWNIKEAQKNLLRTHTTAVSARQLYSLAKKGFVPTKMFSIDRVFRNETLDATHLAEFHQVEGVVAEKNLSLAHVIGLFTEFFRKCGIENLRFKPTYNPYTEPSMEIFAYHQGLKKWVEIGNSGMFRPEMLLPMGLPDNVCVAGFGLSLERPTMIRYGISNIRELFGHKIDLQMVYNNPICRLDVKE
uniref:phenylalanine--tRNA ligase n=1 Tax=Meloidogyne javanica TaxID=6303 RepID=A0A915LVN2_MELJA